MRKSKGEAEVRPHVRGSQKGLYPNCEDGNTKLGTILELLQWKAENVVPEKGFEKLLKILKKKLPNDKELPDSTYAAKVVCPLGLEVEKIHACPNDCILYRGAYKDLNACPVCGALRYKIRRDDPGDADGDPPQEEGSCEGDVVCSYNTTVETSVQKQ